MTAARWLRWSNCDSRNARQSHCRRQSRDQYALVHGLCAASQAGRWQNPDRREWPAHMALQAMCGKEEPRWIQMI